MNLRDKHSSVINEIQNQKLPKREIIKKRIEFSETIQRGKRWQGSAFNIYFLKATERKAGFTVAKKSGNAVFRNRAKRRMREIYRKNRFQIGPYHLVFLAKPTINSQAFQLIEQDFLLFLHQSPVGLPDSQNC